VNESTENIGARRLHCSGAFNGRFPDANDLSGQNITIDADYVSKHLDALVADEDLSRFILYSAFNHFHHCLMGLKAPPFFNWRVL